MNAIVFGSDPTFYGREGLPLSRSGRCQCLSSSGRMVNATEQNSASLSPMRQRTTVGDPGRSCKPWELPKSCDALVKAYAQNRHIRFCHVRGPRWIETAPDLTYNPQSSRHCLLRSRKTRPCATTRLSHRAPPDVMPS